MIFRGVLFVLFAVCGCALGEEAAPFTVLYDTGASSSSVLSSDAVLATKGWGAIAEDALAHSFGGDAVFMNDRVAVVLRKGAAGVEVYSKSAGGCKERASLVLLGADGSSGKLSSVKIIENSQAAVMVEATVLGKNKSSAVFGFRLTAGESLLDVRGGKGAGRVRVVDQSEYVVVPDFFADDMVIDPAVQTGKRTGLPAENSVLGLCDHGGAIVACVWKSSRQNVDLLLTGEGKERVISGYEIDLRAENRLWIAVMEGAGIWHARQVTAVPAKNDLTLEWKPPMPARWRTDFAGGDGVSVSTYFADPDAGRSRKMRRAMGRAGLMGEGLWCG